MMTPSTRTRLRTCAALKLFRTDFIRTASALLAPIPNRALFLAFFALAFIIAVTSTCPFFRPTCPCLLITSPRCVTWGSPLLAAAFPPSLAKSALAPPPPPPPLPPPPLNLAAKPPPFILAPPFSTAEGEAERGAPFALGVGLDPCRPAVLDSCPHDAIPALNAPETGLLPGVITGVTAPASGGERERRGRGRGGGLGSSRGTSEGQTTGRLKR